MLLYCLFINIRERALDSVPLHPLQEVCWGPPSLNITQVGNCGWGLRWDGVGWGKDRVGRGLKGEEANQNIYCIFRVISHTSDILSSVSIFEQRSQGTSWAQAVLPAHFLQL